MTPDKAKQLQQAGCAMTGLGCWIFIGLPPLIFILVMIWQSITG